MRLAYFCSNCVQQGMRDRAVLEKTNFRFTSFAPLVSSVTTHRRDLSHETAACATDVVATKTCHRRDGPAIG